MVRMSLTTFLYNDVVDSVTQTDRLERRVNGTGKGGDYYWAAKLAAAKMFEEGMSYDQAISEVMVNMTVATQRLDNQSILKVLNDFRLAQGGIPRVPPRGEVVAPLNILAVQLEPNFAIEKNGKVTAYVPWMFKDDRLSAKIAGVGIHLLQTKLAFGDYADWRFAMIDTVNGSIFKKTHKNTGEAAERMLRSQEENLANQFKKTG